MWNLLRINIKDTLTTYIFVVNFEQVKYFIYYSGVSIAGLEQVNANWLYIAFIGLYWTFSIVLITADQSYGSFSVEENNMQDFFLFFLNPIYILLILIS